MPTIELVKRARLTPQISHLVFQAPFQHEAGQHVALSAPLEGALQTRYYSIASPPRPDGQIEFCIQQEGTFGRHVRGLRRGDQLKCSEPAGTMRLLHARRPAVYIASGTGVAPIRSILLAQLDANPLAEATLLLGARHSSELLYRDQFQALATGHPGFRFLPTVSGDEASWDGRRGRVLAHIDEAVAGRDGVDAYFCGQPELVAELRERLAKAGIADGRQVYER